MSWFDNDLLRARRLCKLYTSFKKSTSSFNKVNYIDSKNYYQKLLRDKKIDFYINNTPKDFTNSKNFWEFYQSSIKIESDKSGNKCPETLIYENSIITDTQDITNNQAFFFIFC